MMGDRKPVGSFAHILEKGSRKFIPIPMPLTLLLLVT